MYNNLKSINSTNDVHAHFYKEALHASLTISTKPGLNYTNVFFSDGCICKQRCVSSKKLRKFKHFNFGRVCLYFEIRL
jgi:hypothetical protein